MRENKCVQILGMVKFETAFLILRVTLETFEVFK